MTPARTRVARLVQHTCVAECVRMVHMRQRDVANAAVRRGQRRSETWPTQQRDVAVQVPSSGTHAGMRSPFVLRICPGASPAQASASAACVQCRVFIWCAFKRGECVVRGWRACMHTPKVITEDEEDVRLACFSNRSSRHDRSHGDCQVHRHHAGLVVVRPVTLISTLLGPVAGEPPRWHAAVARSVQLQLSMHVDSHLTMCTCTPTHMRLVKSSVCHTRSGGDPAARPATNVARPE